MILGSSRIPLLNAQTVDETTSSHIKSSYDVDFKIKRLGHVHKPDLNELLRRNNFIHVVSTSLLHPVDVTFQHDALECCLAIELDKLGVDQTARCRQ